MRVVLRERGHLFIPILTILVVMYSGYSAPMAALFGTLACFPVAALRRSTRGYLNWPNFIDAFVDGAKNALAGRDGLRLRRHRHRRRHAVRPRHRVHAVRHRAVQGHAAAGAGAHHVRRHRARHGHADDAGLHHHDGAAGARHHQARRDPAGCAHVRVLLRGAVGDHAAGGAGRVRRRGHRQGRPLEERVGGRQDRCGRLHRAVHVGLRAGADDDRRLAAASSARSARRVAASCCSPPACTAIS